jgi:hypothetical protein
MELCCLKHTTTELNLDIQFCRMDWLRRRQKRLLLVGIAQKGVSIDSVLSRLLAQSNNNVEIKNRNESEFDL